MPPPYEADLSTQQSPPQTHARVPRADEDALGSRRHFGAAPQGPQKTHGVNSGPVVRESFSREDRLRKRREFEECYASGVRASGRHLQLFVRGRASGSEPARLGISVPKRVGNAVARNLLRRRLREIFRKNRAALSSRSLDIVVQCRPGAAKARPEELRGDYLDLVRRALSRARGR